MPYSLLERDILRTAIWGNGDGYWRGELTCEECDKTIHFWEPNAADRTRRLNHLKRVHEVGHELDRVRGDW